MRILVLNYEYPPVGAGAGAVTEELVRHYAKLKQEVDVVTMHFGDLPREEPLATGTVYRTPSRRRSADRCSVAESMTYVVGALPQLGRLVREKSYDIVHGHFSLPTGPLCLYLKKRFGLPYIMTCHGSDVPGYDQDRLHMLHRLLLPLNRQILSQAAAVTCPSEWLTELLRKQVGNYNAQAIPHGLDLDPFKPTEKRHDILLAGRLVHMKNHHLVLQALQSLQLPDNLDVQVAGDGPMRAELEKLAQGLPVTFHGWLPARSPELCELFNASRIFCMPSAAESFGVVFVEAMAAGCAVIAGRGSAAEEFITHEENGLLVEPGNATELASALHLLLNNGDLVDQLGANARQSVTTAMAWPTVALKYLSLAERVLNRDTSH